MIKYIEMIKNEALKNSLKGLHESLIDYIISVPASIKYHHNWTGGYQDHVTQVIKQSIALYKSLYDMSAKPDVCITLGDTTFLANVSTAPKVNFILDDVILVAYIHDLDKLFRYQRSKDGNSWEYANVPSYDESAKVVQLCANYGIQLEDIHLEALAMHHGGWSANSNRPMSPLAVVIHSADLISTFITNHKEELTHGSY